MTIPVFIAIFLVSLQSLYSNDIGAPVYSVIGAVFLMALAILRSSSLPNTKRWNVPKYYILQILAPILFLFISLIAALLSSEFEPKRLLSYMVIAFVPLSYALLSARTDPIKIASGLVLIHSSVLFFQFVLFYLFRIDFDPVHLLSDVQQRGWGGMQEHNVLGGFRRLGGLYSEPGTYATFVAPLVAVLFLKPADSKVVKISILGIISLFLTFSIYAWTFCLILLAIKFLHSKWSVLVFAPIILGAYQLAVPYIQFRFAARSGDDGTEFRSEILEAILQFSTEGLTNFLFGSGLRSVKVPFEYVGAINDIGLLFYIFLTSGIFGVFVILMILVDACWRLRLAGVAVALILIVSKISIFAPMFWVILIVVLHAGIQNSNSTVQKE